jgi:hypothetical protein
MLILYQAKPAAMCWYHTTKAVPVGTGRHVLQNSGRDAT